MAGLRLPSEFAAVGFLLHQLVELPILGFYWGCSHMSRVEYPMFDMHRYIDGDLFSHHVLETTVRDDPVWHRADVDKFLKTLDAIFSDFPYDAEPDKRQTSEEFIWPVLRALGWSSCLRQQKFAELGHFGVIDSLLFLDETKKNVAKSIEEEWRRFEFGATFVDSHRWERPLGISTSEGVAPSAHMLRHLRLVDEASNGNINYGILTNGAAWELYYQGAMCVSRQYFGIKLKKLYFAINERSANDADQTECALHCMRIFMVMFGRDSFAVPS